MKVKFWHKKKYYPTKWFAGRKCGDITYYDGISLCIIEQDGKYAVGISKCSQKDQFNKKIARTIAEGRAIKALGNNLLYLPICTQLVSADWIEQALKRFIPEVVEQLI